MVSYADFITLLFGFFVVMYSISSVNEGKYRVLSESLVHGFRGVPKTIDPVQLGTVARSQDLFKLSSARRGEESSKTIKLPSGPVSDQPLEPIPLPEHLSVTDQDKILGNSDRLDELFKKINNYGEDLVSQDLMQVRRTENWIELELNESMLFSGASASMQQAAGPLLEKIANMLNVLPNTVHVEGHADSRPIRTSAFPSNWELSAARAASVVNVFVQQGIEPSRLAAVGYGQFRPVAANDTEDGRRRNRRVVIVVHSTDRDARDVLGQDSDRGPEQ